MEELQTLILPFRTMVLQGLLLIVATAIEAAVIHNRLGISKRGSVQYALALNLTSTVIGWTLLFTLEPFLSEPWRLNLMSYVLFNRSFGPVSSASTLMVVGLFGMYLGTFLIETQAMNILLRIWAPPIPRQEYDTSEVKYNRTQRYKSSWTARFRSNALLRANAISYTAILVLLFVLQRARFI